MLKETEDHLHRQLVKLGDMMGDGLHHEPDGKWIEREYKKILKALGYLPKQTRTSNVAAINEVVGETLKTNKCPCGGGLKQTRSGSFKVACVECESRYQFKAKKVKRG